MESIAKWNDDPLDFLPLSQNQNPHLSNHHASFLHLLNAQNTLSHPWFSLKNPEIDRLALNPETINRLSLNPEIDWIWTQKSIGFISSWLRCLIQVSLSLTRSVFPLSQDHHHQSIRPRWNFLAAQFSPLFLSSLILISSWVFFSLVLMLMLSWDSWHNAWVLKFVFLINCRMPIIIEGELAHSASFHLEDDGCFYGWKFEVGFGSFECSWGWQPSAGKKFSWPFWIECHISIVTINVLCTVVIYCVRFFVIFWKHLKHWLICSFKSFVW